MSGDDSITPMPLENQRRSARRRAPRRGGRRVQLTVPDGMWSALVEVAQAAGTTPNDALVRLASERLDERERAVRLRRRAEERWRAFVTVLPAEGAAAEPLGEDDLVELSRAFRTDAA